MALTLHLCRFVNKIQQSDSKSLTELEIKDWVALDHNKYILWVCMNCLLAEIGIPDKIPAMQGGTMSV